MKEHFCLRDRYLLYLKTISVMTVELIPQLSSHKVQQLNTVPKQHKTSTVKKAFINTCSEGSKKENLRRFFIALHSIVAAFGHEGLYFTV